MNVRRGFVNRGYADVLRPLLFAAHSGSPEAIHEDMIRSLSVVAHTPGLRNLARLLTQASHDSVTVAGIRFPGRVGLAAGMDKDGLAALAWQYLGFAFAELGTVTALAQPGNPRPRVFRLRDSQALINRMGFNNDGALALANRLAVAGIYRGNRAAGIPLGISLGKSKVVDVAEAVPDYLASFAAVATHADYVAVNVSSPNTPGLRTLQDQGALSELLSALVAASRNRAAVDRADPMPVFVKIAPDLTWGQIDEVLRAAFDSGVSGIIATNTTLERTGLAPQDQALATEAGGLSGRPLTQRAREVVTYVVASTDLPVIGSGGVMTADDASALFDAGASLVQIYTGFIYAGPALIGTIAERTNLGR